MGDDTRSPVIRFLIDQNVARSVGEFLGRYGHEVLYSRDVLSTMSPDQLIAFTAETRGLVVVTHDKDFKRYRELLAGGFRQRFEQGAGRISLTMRESLALKRITEEIDAIEFNYVRALRGNTRLIMQITSTTYSVTSHASRKQ